VKELLVKKAVPPLQLRRAVAFEVSMFDPCALLIQPPRSLATRSLNPIDPPLE